MKQSRVMLVLALLLIPAWAHGQSPATPLPVLAVDPYWPQIPETWIFGVGAGIATDAQNNVWVIHRPGMVTEKKVCCKPAPVVMQFDAPDNSSHRITSRPIPTAIYVAEDLGGQRVQKFVLKSSGSPQR